MEISDLRPGVVYKLNRIENASIFYVDINLSMDDNISSLDSSNRDQKIKYFGLSESFIFSNKIMTNKVGSKFPIFFDFKSNNHFIFIYNLEKLLIEEI